MSSFLSSTPRSATPNGKSSPLPSHFTPAGSKDRTKHDSGALETTWAEGLRGIAAVGVVCSHLTLAFFIYLIPPTQGAPVNTPLLFQRPIFRLVAQGDPWVALFFILTGFVNPLKPLKQALAHDADGALLGVGRTAFARIPRLVLPATAVTLISWFMCQFGAYEIARHSDAYWFYNNSRQPSSSWIDAIVDLVYAIRDTWVWSNNDYDQPQWALAHLVKASLYIFVALLVTLTMNSRFRLSILALSWLYSWIHLDGLCGINVFFGMMLAEVHSLRLFVDFPNRSILQRVLAILSALIALHFMSFPSEYHDTTAWTRQLRAIADSSFPGNADAGRYWNGLGAQLLCISIYVSPDLRWVLNHRAFTFLGGISFPIYLIHGPMARSVLAWATYGPTYFAQGWPAEGQRLAMGHKGLLFIILPAFAFLLLRAAVFWQARVEPYFARATKYLTSLGAVEPSGPPAFKQ